MGYWPGLWGRIYWFLLHAGARSYRNRLLSELEQAKWKQFVFNLTLLLPCDICRPHAIAYISKHAMNWTKGTDLENYFFQFHNFVNVNAASKRIELTSEEAESELQKALSAQSCDIDNLQNAFLLDFWIVLVWPTLLYSKTPDKPSEAEQSVVRNIFEAAPYVFPFREFQLHDGSFAADAMLEIPIDVSTQQACFITLTGMYNSVAGDFGKLYITAETLKAQLVEGSEKEQLARDRRAQEARAMDHAKILLLQNQLKTRIPQDPNSPNSASNAANSAVWFNVAVAESCMLLFMVCLYIVSTFILLKKPHLLNKLKREPIPATK